MPITWERRYEALKAIHDELTEDSLSLFFPTQLYGEVGKLVKYKGKLYAFIMPYGYIYSFDGEKWELVYDVRKNGIRISDDFCMTAWGSHHWTKDDKLYFFGVFWKTGGPAIVRFDGESWEFYEYGDTIGQFELSRATEFGNYLYVGTFSKNNIEKIFRSSDGVNWTEVLSQNEGYGIQDLCTTGNPADKIWAVKLNGKILKSTDGTTWDTDYTTADGKGLWRCTTASDGNKALAGGEETTLHMWDGGYQAWRKIGNFDKNLTITEIKNFGLGGITLVTCRAFPNEKAARTSLGALFLITDDSRIIPVLYTFGYVLFGVEEFGGHLYISFGWDDVVAKTQFKSHFCGVKKMNMVELTKLIRLPALPKSETINYANIDVAANATYEIINVGAYGRKKFRLKNTESNVLNYEWYYTFDGKNWFSYAGTSNVSPGKTKVFNFSDEIFSALRLKLWTNPGAQTSARLEMQLDNQILNPIEKPLTRVPEGKTVTKIGFWEDSDGNIKYIKFQEGDEVLFTLTFSNAGTSSSETWNITRS